MTSPNPDWPLPSKGEIWNIDWSPGRGSEQTGFRPALIVQNDYGNHSPCYPNTIVAAISTKGQDIPFHVLIKFSKMNGLAEDSYIKCEQILTISKSRLAGKKPRGRIASEELISVNEAIKLSLAL